MDGTGDTRSPALNSPLVSCWFCQSIITISRFPFSHDFGRVFLSSLHEEITRLYVKGRLPANSIRFLVSILSRTARPSLYRHNLRRSVQHHFHFNKHVVIIAGNIRCQRGLPPPFLAPNLESRPMILLGFNPVAPLLCGVVVQRGIKL